MLFETALERVGGAVHDTVHAHSCVDIVVGSMQLATSEFARAHVRDKNKSHCIWADLSFTPSVSHLVIVYFPLICIRFVS